MDIKEAEARLNKGLAMAGQVFVEAMSKIDAEFASSDKTANEIYREQMAKNRTVLDAAIMKAQTDFNAANAAADEAYRDAPNKAKAVYESAKASIRAEYEKEKTRLQNEFNEAA